MMTATMAGGTSLADFVAEELHAIASALVGGARYGLKIRVPHALVMTFLFRRDLTSHQKVRNVVKVAWEHSSNLAAFATIYKVVLAALKWASRHLRRLPDMEKSFGKRMLSMLLDGPGSPYFPMHHAPLPGHPERPYHSLLAGSVGGYMIWGRYSSVNYQLVLYLTSRVLLGVLKRGYEHVMHPNKQTHQSSHHTKGEDSFLQHPRLYSAGAAIVWGLVMVLFEESPHVLHKSLRSSMEEIYRYQLSDLSGVSRRPRAQQSDESTAVSGGMLLG